MDKKQEAALLEDDFFFGDNRPKVVEQRTSANYRQINKLQNTEDVSRQNQNRNISFGNQKIPTTNSQTTYTFNQQSKHVTRPSEQNYSPEKQVYRYEKEIIESPTTGYYTRNTNFIQSNNILRNEKTEIRTKTNNIVKSTNDYEFYEADIEDNHFESGFNQNGAKAKAGFPFAIIGLLASLVLVGLLATAVARGILGQCGIWGVALLIIASFGVIGFIVGIISISGIIKSHSKKLEQNETLVSTSFVLCIILGILILFSSIVICRYKLLYHGQMITTYSNQGEWENKFGDNWTFEEGWGVQRKVLLWASIMAIVSGVCLLTLSYFLWKSLKTKTATARILLGVAILIGGILSLLALYYSLQAGSLRSEFGALDLISKLNWPKVLSVILFISFIGFLFAGIIALVRKTGGHCLLGSALALLALVVVCFLMFSMCNLSKRISSYTNKGEVLCRDTLSSIHKDEVASFCPLGKYIDTSLDCTRAFRTKKWEEKNEQAYVNPGCCGSGAAFVTCPLFSATALGFLVVGMLILSALSLFLLSDRSEYLEFSEKRCSKFPCLSSCILLLLMIGFILWWVLGPKFQTFNKVSTLPILKSSGFMGFGTDQWESEEDKSFTKVDLSKVYPDGIPPSVYVQGLQSPAENDLVTSAKKSHRFSTQNSVVNIGEAICSESVSHCGHRVAILLTNGHFDSLNGNSHANLGSPKSRNIFYNDHNSFNDYILLFGDSKEVQKAIDSLSFVPVDIGKSSRMSFIIQKLDISTLSSTGLTEQENTLETNLSASGKVQTDFSAFSTEDPGIGSQCYALNSCLSNLKCTKENCKVSFVFHTSSGQAKIVVPLKVFDSNNSKVNYDGGELQSESSYHFEGTSCRINEFEVKDSQATFVVPVPIVSSLEVELILKDPKDRYLPYRRNFSLPINSKSPYQVFDAILLTKSGKGCVGSTNVETCFASQKTISIPLNITIRDAETAETVSLTKINLLEGEGKNGPVLSYALSGLLGVASFENVALDYYTLLFEGDGRYLPTEQQIILQKESDGEQTFLLRSRSTDYALIEQVVRQSSTNSDEDLVISVSSDKGKQCRISMENKFCAFGTHLSSKTLKSEGIERASLDNFAVAHYLVYWDGSAKDSATCGRVDPSKVPFYPDNNMNKRRLKFNWKKARRLSSQYYHLLYCFTGFGLNSIQHLNKDVSSEPSADKYCSPLYPNGSEYSLSRLNSLLAN